MCVTISKASTVSHKIHDIKGNNTDSKCCNS